MVAASSGFVVVQQKLCERCGRSFTRAADSTCPYCPPCTAFFTALAELERAPAAPAPIDLTMTGHKKTGPKLPTVVTAMAPAARRGNTNTRGGGVPGESRKRRTTR
jgi:hypothetical protein